MNKEIILKNITKYYKKYNKYFPIIGTIIILSFYTFSLIKFLSFTEVLPRVVLYSIGSFIIKELIPINILYLLGTILIICCYNDFVIKKKRVKKYQKIHLAIVRFLAIMPYFHIFCWIIINGLFSLFNIVEIPKFIIFIFDIIEFLVCFIYFVDLLVLIKMFIKKYNLDVFVKKRLSHKKK